MATGSQHVSLEHASLAAQLVPAVRAAGRVIMAHYHAGVTAEIKSDHSPVTVADRDAEAILLAALNRVAPAVPVIAEEEASAGRTPAAAPLFFLVDPLDGTKEFLARRDEFTVNVALVCDGRPTFGIVYAPALAQLFVTMAPDVAIEMKTAAQDPEVALSAMAGTRLQTARADAERVRIVASRSHMDAETATWIERYKVSELRNAGSSLKFCVVARGEADIYPRFAPTMEWDTAAGQAILQAAGGVVTTVDQRPFVYGKSDCGYLNGGFIAWGGQPF